MPIRTVLQDLGARIERFRLSRNLRQEDLANRAGLSRVTISKLERGNGGSVDTLARILRALNLGDRLADLVPDASVSPMDPKSGSKTLRQRARSPQEAEPRQPWTWGNKTDGAP